MHVGDGCFAFRLVTSFCSCSVFEKKSLFQKHLTVKHVSYPSHTMFMDMVLLRISFFFKINIETTATDSLHAHFMCVFYKYDMPLLHTLKLCTLMVCKG